jgi:hypothetical protein
METKTIVLRVTQYTRTPGGRYPSDGPFPGSVFLSDYLEPAFLQAVNSGCSLIVDLDGVASYASSFLDEAFGGLASRYGSARVKETVRIRSVDEPYLEEDIWIYVDEASEGHAGPVHPRSAASV